MVGVLWQRILSEQCRQLHPIKAEYQLVQSQYEAFDQRVLGLKALAAPLMSAGIAVGLKDSSLTLLGATVLAALCLWFLEAIWKSFQYSYEAPIKKIEAWFRGEEPVDLAPFQIFASWGAHYDERFKGRLSPYWDIVRQPFVALPYVMVVIVGGLTMAFVAWA